MSYNDRSFSKDNLRSCLKELAKQYRKLSGKNTPAEIILVGGAAVLARYGFRDMTTDVDAIIQASSAMKDAVKRVADLYDLPDDWLNSDFLHTDSATQKLLQFSEYYATFSNIVTIRVVTAEYLIAMKLRAGRRYKNDLSDIIGILAEHQKKEEPITPAMVHKAVEDLYGSWDVLPETSREFFAQLCGADDLSVIYEKTRAMEQYAGNKLRTLDRDYPGLVGTDTIQNILDRITKGHSIFENDASDDR
jgi:hypothetical protein